MQRRLGDAHPVVAGPCLPVVEVERDQRPAPGRLHQGAESHGQGLVGEGDKVPDLIEKGKSKFVGTEIQGKTLGVVGLGAIGTMVANAAESLGMEVWGYDPFLSIEAAWKLSRTIKKAPNLDRLFAESDYITLHVPQNKDTKGFVNSSKFAIMKKGVVLLNFARGGLVDTVALKKAIADGIVRCYVTDFPDEEVIKTEKVIAIPHLGASTEESEENCAIMAALQLMDFMENGNIKNSVNFPECNLDRNGKKRITITNQNICLLYTSPSPRDRTRSRMPSSA